MSSGQLSFFSADARPATPDDLEGWLCGPGQVVRRGDEARLSVLVRDEWRIPALLDGLDALELTGEVVEDTAAEGRAVRTPFATVLLPLAQRWSGGGAKRAPADLLLDGPRLRWWAFATGRADPLGYALGLGAQDEAVWAGVGAALARAGLPAALLGPRADGPAYRVTGLRRIARLRELLGEPPDGFPDLAWPARS